MADNSNNTYNYGACYNTNNDVNNETNVDASNNPGSENSSYTFQTNYGESCIYTYHGYGYDPNYNSYSSYNNGGYASYARRPGDDLEYKYSGK